MKTHTLTFYFSLPFGLKGHAIRCENLRNLYIWFKSPKWEFWFPSSWKKRGFFWGQEFAILLKKEVPATWSRNFLDIFHKNPHISRKKFMKWPSFLAIRIILGRFGSFPLIKLPYRVEFFANR